MAATTHVPVVVIGAGINGAGIARDLAMRGFGCALIDKGDMCSGTSAWSTRLIHGGLRYLEYYEFDLVRESLREREILLRQAPHLVHGLPLMIPIFRGARRGPALIRLGMVAYDILSFDKSLPWHRMLNREATLNRAPGLRESDLRGAAIYFDAQVELAERLTLENLLDARDFGCRIMLGHEVMEIGERHLRLRSDSGEEQTVTCDLILNVSGPWVDQVLQRTAGQGAFPRQMGGTKGSHLVCDRFAGLPDEALYVEASADGRPYFIVPWNDQLLIGTTDLRSEENLDTVRASAEECRYLLDETNKLFPQANLTADKIHFTYSGVRPLPHVKAGSTGAITRRHQLVEHERQGVPFWSVVGGKLTTYRSLAEEVVDRVVKQMDVGRRPCGTRRRPLPGFTALHQPRFVGSLAERHGISPHTARHLALTYGGWAESIGRMAAQAPELKQVVDEPTGAIAAEVVWSCRREEVRHLDDLMLRRMLVGWRQGLGVPSVDAIMQWAGPELGWDMARQSVERDRYLAAVERFKSPL